MSTYYEYQDVKVMIARKLMAMDGWTVYGYHADESDMMTDYYSPAYWGGVAEKNGYILCVDVYGKSKPEEIRKYNYDGTISNMSVAEKISKLKEITAERGASEQEEESARKSILKLEEKAKETTKETYVVVGTIPEHMANPPRCNWHIEKDGIYVVKGNGILKYSSVDKYYRYDHYSDDMKLYITDPEKYRQKVIDREMSHWNENEERATQIANECMESMAESKKMIDEFEAFINKIDTTCGGLLGDGDNTIYEKVTVTEYKKEIKPFETEIGSIKEGQCFIVKGNFNYGIRTGAVYRIHETEYKGQKSYHANKLNGKNTKECTGMASRDNYWYINTKKFPTWFEKGALAWCELKEVKTPYEVEKVVKKTVSNKADKKEQTTTADTVNGNYTYDIIEDTDTRDGSQIWLVKIQEKLSKEEYAEANKYMKSLGGYYSRFKHAFLFKENPTEFLNGNVNTEAKTKTEETVEEPTTETTTQYIITEDVHTKTGKPIWVVTFADRLTKEMFAEEKQKLATLKGFYSGFKKGFIFNYDPTEKLQTA